MPIPALLAPLIGTLVANGLNILAGAVTAKGKEFVEEKLGVDIETAALSQDGIVKLKELEIGHEEFLINAAMEEGKRDLENTKSAREANAVIQASENASPMAKNMPYYLDMLIVAGTLLLAYMIFFVGIPPENKDIAFAAFGSLVTMCGTIINFHRGSSAGSKASGDTVRNMMNQLTKEGAK